MKHAASHTVATILLAGALSIAPIPQAQACLWDRDTLRMEAQPFPGVPEILTGRFERQPPRYYRMRLERVSRELDRDPSNLGLYDDAGVACDRLGDSDAAIQWMDRKHAAMAGLNPDSPEIRNHRYRLLANLGTFQAHRWLRGGANRADMSDLLAAEKSIASAIELNPDAHFGRELYQLAAIRWLIELADVGTGDASASDRGAPKLFSDPPCILDVFANQQADGPITDLEPDRVVRGMSGLVVLGEAWESIDVLFALEAALAARGDHSMALLTRLRINELSAAGRTSLHPRFALPSETTNTKYGEYSALGLLSSPPRNAQVQHEEPVREYFREARREADRTQAARWAYMESRFDLGLHPDTHADFWAAWKEPPLTPLPGGLTPYPTEREQTIRLAISVSIGAVMLIGGAIFFRSRRKRQRFAHTDRAQIP